MTTGDRARANARITLRNLIAARWVLIVLASAAALVVAFADDRLPVGLMPRCEHPLAFVAVVLAWLALNLLSMAALRRDQVHERLAGVHLLIDAVALTALLGLSGGPANPFTILYFLPITLATQVSPRWTWTLAAACVTGFAALFVLAPIAEPVPIERSRPAAEADHAAHAHHADDQHDEHARHEQQAASPPAVEPPTSHAEHFEGHQLGMWIAFGIAGVLITVFVHRTALALAQQRDELAELRQVTLEDRHLTAIGTLAAGAAHELGSPLTTIGVLIDELPHMTGPDADEARATVREQVQRCKLIVARMASPELRVSALGVGESWTIAELAEELGELALGIPLTLAVDPDVGARVCRQPFEVLSQLLRELISNASEACRRTGDPARGVALAFTEHDGRLLVDVVDRGVGMDADALAAAFDPFRSTRPAGEGMGLGLYLARAHVRQLGGTLTLRSTLGEGTTAHVELPRAPEVPK